MHYATVIGDRGRKLHLRFFDIAKSGDFYYDLLHGNGEPNPDFSPVVQIIALLL